MKLRTCAAVFGGLVKILPGGVLEKIEESVFFSSPELLPKEGAADIAFVFGAENDFARVRKAYELYQAGVVKKVLISGGVGKYNTLRDRPEAAALAAQILEWGMKYRDLIVEEQARNSYENVANSLALLRERGYAVEELSYVVVTSDFHLRRCMSILRRALKYRAHIYYAGTEHPVATKEKWKQSDLGRFLVCKEALQIRNV